MHISRIQIEEGFLDGLDLHFTTGLNVLIGARGTGKTSLIELIRFALGVNNFTSDARAHSEGHARAVLGSGQVIVTITLDNGDEVVASRSAMEDSPRVAGYYVSPLIFSQTEIEVLGLQSASRLRLLDGFVSDGVYISAEEDSLIGEIRSLCAEIASKRSDIEQLEQQLSSMPDIQRQLEELKPSEDQFSQASLAAATKTADLQKIVEQTSTLTVATAQYERFLNNNTRRQAAIRQIISQWGDDDAISVEAAALTEAGNLVTSAYKNILDTHTALDTANQKAQDAKKQIEIERLSAEAAARSLRQEIEEVQQGAGQIARKGQQLREQLANLTALSTLVDMRRRDLAAKVQQRDVGLDRLDALREERYKLRLEEAKKLNDRLNPRISVEVERAGQVEAYAGAIATMLRGSGLRYNELAQTIARAVSPRELMEWAETNNVDALSDAVSLPKERAARLLVALRDISLGEIGTLLVEDDACFNLLDGVDYKPISVLSMGQRCTVILPIILERLDTILIVDQPEDHIDNAFIADTLIKALVGRSSQGQIIFSTHNANIPVLGDAAQVTQLGSDGRRGYVAVSAPLNDSASVNAITTVMEGGSEAFRHRAEFYEQHQ
jgi:chromosome segregation ATPase